MDNQYMSIGYRNHNPQPLTRSVTRLIHLRVYDSRDRSHQSSTSPSLYYSFTHTHNTLPLSLHVLLLITLGNISSINLVFIFRCSSSPSNPVYVRRVDFSVLVFSHRTNTHTYLKKNVRREEARRSHHNSRPKWVTSSPRLQFYVST